MHDMSQRDYLDPAEDSEAIKKMIVFAYKNF